jgi:hypothetical protein
VPIAVDAVELVVDRIAEPRARGLGEVQRVFLEERARELELLGRQAVVDQELQLAQPSSGRSSKDSLAT